MTDEPAPTIATLRDSLSIKRRPPSARAQRHEIAMMDASPTRWSELLTPEYAIATTTLCLGVSLFAFNGFLVSTSLPTAVEELGGAALISWSLTVYLVFAIVGGSGAAVIKQPDGELVLRIVHAQGGGNRVGEQRSVFIVGGNENVHRGLPVA